MEQYLEATLQDGSPFDEETKTIISVCCRIDEGGTILRKPLGPYVSKVTDDARRRFEKDNPSTMEELRLWFHKIAPEDCDYYVYLNLRDPSRRKEK